DWIVADTRAQLGGPLPAPEDKARLAARDVSRAPLWRLLWDRDRLDGFPLSEAQPTPLMTSAVIERLTWSETPELPDLPRPVRRAADVGPGMVDRGGDRSTFTVPLEGGYVAHAVFSGSVEALEEAARQRDAVGLVDGVVVEVCRAPGPDWACPDDAAIAVLRPLDRRLSARARGVDG
ncbi:MAG TPA: hypothetical protein RMF84_19050, partial [Polyangiaceae bacterium LLY-WYZ-14_1]|nr:hypothetical protein [Polyangiaceae bacterium LLY-WYZ-14_1]